MLRLTLAALFLILQVAHSSCKTLNNRTVQIQLDCGMDIPLGSSYAVIQGPDGHQMDRSEFEAVRLSGDQEESLRISKKGCFIKPDSGKILIRAKNGQWVKFYELGKNPLPDLIKLEDVSEQNFVIRCDQDILHSVSTDFELSKLFIHNISEDLQSTLRLQVAIYDSPEKKTPVRTETLNLQQAKGFKPFASLKNDSRVVLELKLLDQLKKRTKDVVACPFKLDRTPPDVQLTAGRSENAKSIDWQGVQSIALIDPASNFEFTSADSDADHVAFCMKQLRDDRGVESQKLSEELVGADSISFCDEEHFKNIALKSPIPFEERRGFWSIWFQGVDALGNKALVSQKTILFFDQNKINLLRKNAMAETLNQINQQNHLEAVKEALEAYQEMKKLGTEYERRLIELETFVAMKRVFDLKFIKIPLRGHSTLVTDIKFTPKEDHIVSTSDSDTKFWNYKNARKELEVEVGPTGVAVDYQLLFDTQRNRMMQLSRFYTGKMLTPWNLDTLEMELDIPLTSTSVISPSGDYMCTVKSPHNLFKLNPVSTGRSIGGEVQNEDRVVAFGRTDTEVIVQKANRELQLYNLESRQITRRFGAISDDVSIVDFSKNRSIFGIGTTRGEIVLWDIENGTELDRFNMASSISLLRLSEDGMQLLAVAVDGTLFSIKIKSPSASVSHELSHKVSIGDISRDFTRIVASDFSRTDAATLFVKLSDPDHLIFDVFSTNAPADLDISSTSKNLTYASSDGPVITWDSNGKKRTSQQIMNPSRTMQVKLNKDGKALYGISGTILWRRSIDPEGPTETLVDFHEQLNAFDVTQGEEYAVVTRQNGISVVNLQSKAIRSAQHIGSNFFGLVKWNPQEDGFITTAFYKGKLVNWDAETLLPKKSLHRHEMRVLSMEWNAEKTLLASGSADGTIKIWDFKRNKLVQTLLSTDWVTGLAFHPGGRFLISSSRDNVLTYWDIETGKKLYDRSRPSINAIRFDENGKHVFYGNEGTSADYESSDIEYIFANICGTLKEFLPVSLCPQ